MLQGSSPSTNPQTTNTIFNMKTFGAVSTAVAAATVFASSVYGQIDPIVIKVESTTLEFVDHSLTKPSLLLGFQIFLQDEWHRIVGTIHPGCVSFD